MRALLVLFLKGNNLQAAGGKALAEGLKGNQVITELNIASNMLHWTTGIGPDMSGVIALADVIPDMRAILSVNLLQNSIGTDVTTDQAEALASILKEHPTLKSLCGNRGDETELNMSGKKMGAGGATMLATEIVGNGAMTKLDISSNDIRAEGGKALAAGLKGNQMITELNISNNDLGKNAEYDDDTSGVIAIADAIPDMGALIKFDISSNAIGAEQEGDLQRICVASGIELAIDN
jgi:Ran GTPase-activating protein (RanGAP) involved in mRNA processing and transport